MSNFAIIAPVPSSPIFRAITSILTYEREHKLGAMPSLTLAAREDDKSTIRRHRPGGELLVLPP